MLKRDIWMSATKPLKHWEVELYCDLRAHFRTWAAFAMIQKPHSVGIIYSSAWCLFIWQKAKTRTQWLKVWIWNFASKCSAGKRLESFVIPIAYVSFAGSTRHCKTSIYVDDTITYYAFDFVIQQKFNSKRGSCNVLLSICWEM